MKAASTRFYTDGQLLFPSFPPPEAHKGNFSVSWLYRSFARMWKHWLPADARKIHRSSPPQLGVFLTLGIYRQHSL